MLSASVGNGHVREAEAVEAACRVRYPEAAVSHLDVLTVTPPAFRRVYGELYLDFVNHLPEALGIVYDVTNRPPKSRVIDRMLLAIERLNTRDFVKFVKSFDPDVVCHTHLLPAEILAHQKRKGAIFVPDAVVVTDYDVHRFWLASSGHRWFVAREENRVHLRALGADPSLVRVTGIPIDPAFAAPRDRAALRGKHGFEVERPLLLVLCGGFGVGPIETLVERLWASVRDADVVIVTGRNAELHERLEARTPAAPTPTRVLGFTREMSEWMAIAGLVVTKPGGLTSAEALAAGLPLVIVNPIPGQETRNATMLLEEGAAVSGENLHTIAGGSRGSSPRRSAWRRCARRPGASPVPGRRSTWPRSSARCSERLAYCGSGAPSAWKSWTSAGGSVTRSSCVESG